MAHPTTTERRDPPAPMRHTPGIGTHDMSTTDIRAQTYPPGSTAGVGTIPKAGIGMLPGTEEGVGQMGAAPSTEPLGPLKPVLFDDIDPILLARLYPDTVDGPDARAQAMAAGEAVAVEGAEMMASQNEPVFYEGDGVPPEERERRREAVRASGGYPGSQQPPGTPPPPRPPGAPQPHPQPTPHPADKKDDKKDDKK